MIKIWIYKVIKLIINMIHHNHKVLINHIIIVINHRVLVMNHKILINNIIIFFKIKFKKLNKIINYKMINRILINKINKIRYLKNNK